MYNNNDFSALLLLKNNNNNNNKMQVLVNGNRMATFKHRMMADIVNAVAIDGDVSIDKVAVL